MSIRPTSQSNPQPNQPRHHARTRVAEGLQLVLLAAGLVDEQVLVHVDHHLFLGGWVCPVRFGSDTFDDKTNSTPRSPQTQSPPETSEPPKIQTTHLIARLDLLAEADARALVGVALARGDAVAEEDARVRLGHNNARAGGAEGDGGVLWGDWIRL